MPFGVRVRSKVDRTYATVVEGDVEVGAFKNIDATIGPKTSRGRRSGKHHVDMTNWGNEPVLVELTAADPDERLGFIFKSPVVELPVGSGLSVDLKVKPANTFLRGPAARQPFTVTARQAGAAPNDESAWRRDLDAAFEQRPILPGWVMLLIPLIAIAAAGVIWWMNREENIETASEEAADQPPSTPAAFEVAPAGAAITVSWPAVDGAESYKVLWVEPATRDAPEPTVFQTTDVPGSQNSTRIEEGVEPETEYCFQLVAVNAVGESAPTPPQCTTTGTDSGAAAPADVAVTHLTEDRSRAEVSWTDTTGGESEHVVLHDGAPLPSPIPAGQTSVAVELAQGENCFQVFSQDGDQASEMSEEVCVDGPGGDGGTGTDGTGTTGAGTGGDLGFIAVVFSTQIGDAGAAQAAEARRAELEQAGFAAQVLNSLDYDAIPDGADGDGSLLVYIGGFETREAAVAFCDDHSDQFATGCLYYQPGEPSTSNWRTPDIESRAHHDGETAGR